MKKLSILFSALLFATSALAGQPAKIVTGDVFQGFKNTLINGSFDYSTYNFQWVTTTATPSKETSNLYDGKQSMKLTFSSSTGETKNTTTPIFNTNGVNYEATCAIKTTLTTMQVCSIVAGVEGNCQNAPSDGNWHYVSSTFVGPSDGTTVGVKAKTSASTTGTAYVDDCYVGPNRSLSQVSQSYLVGTATQLGASPCIFSATGSSNENSYSTVGTAGSCTSAWTNTGAVSVSGPTTSALTISNAQAGNYLVLLNAGLFNAGGGQCNFRFTDGTNTFGYGFAQFGSTTSIGNGAMAGSISYTGAQSSVTFQVQSAGSGTQSCALQNDAAGRKIEWKVYFFPSQSQLVVNTASGPSSWSGSLVGAGGGWSTTSSSYAAPSAATTSTTLTQSTNVNFGTVTAAATTAPGITFTPSKTGSYWVCSSFTADNATLNDVAMARLVDSNSNVLNGGTQASAAVATASVPFSLCGISSITSLSAITYSLQLGAPVGGTSAIVQGANTPISWSIVPLNLAFPAPILAGGVTANGTGNYRTEYAFSTGSCTASPCTITSQSGGFTSITRAGTGQYILTFSKAFSASPACQVSGTGVSNGNLTSFQFNSNSSSAVSFNVYNSNTGVAQDLNNMNVICMGSQ